MIMRKTPRDLFPFAHKPKELCGAGTGTGVVHHLGLAIGGLHTSELAVAAPPVMHMGTKGLSALA